MCEIGDLEEREIKRRFVRDMIQDFEDFEYKSVNVTKRLMRVV